MLLKPEVKEKWVRALLSKRYKQTTGRLEALYPGGEVRNCCLGVLTRVCDLGRRTSQKSIFLDKKVPSEDILETTYHFPKAISNKQTGTIPPSTWQTKLILSPITFENKHSHIQTPFGDKTFEVLNDSGLSFETIATMILIWC